MLALLLVGWLVAALALGYPVAAMALPKEIRASVLVSYGLIAGHVFQGLLLIVIWGWIPLGTGYYVVVGTSLVLGGAMTWARPQVLSRAKITWGLSAPQTTLIVALLAVFAFVGHRVLTVGYQFGDPEILWLHSAITERMTQGLYPTTSPVEPDDHLRYRFAFHTLAASLRANSSVPPTEALAAAAAMILPLMLIALAGASVRFFETPKPGIAAALLGIFGGSLLPLYRGIEALFTGQADFRDGAELVSGLIWHGNTFDMIHVSPTIAMGFVILTCELWLVAEAMDQRDGNWVAWAAAAAGLAYLGIMNEVHFAFLAAGIVASPIAASLRAGRADTWRHLRLLLPAVIMVAFALTVVSLRGGLAGGMRLVGSGADSMQMVLNLDHFGEVVVPPRPVSPSWVPLLSVETQLDSDFAVLLVPLVALIAWWKRDTFLLRPAIIATGAIIAWTTMYSRQVPADTYRFGQMAFTVFLTILPFAAWSWMPGAFTSRRGFSVPAAAGITVATMVMAPHVAAALVLAVSPPGPTIHVVQGPDYEAAKFLKSSVSTHRIFVPLESPDGDIRDLYRPKGPGAATRELLAFSGHAVPLGHFSYWNPEAYLPYYREAGVTFDRRLLSKLKIDWVYVLPSYLGTQQRSNLDAARNRGDLLFERSFGEPGAESERWLFRFAGAG